MRKQFSKTVHNLAKKDNNLTLLIGDISHYLLRDFERDYKDRFFNAGICEQSLIGVAAGMAMNGMRPIVHTIAPFCVERAYEQIKVDLCYQKTDVTIVSVGGSFDYGHAGCTHHCYEDIAILRALPNICIFSPGTQKEFDELFKKSWGNGLPKYFKINQKMHSYDFEVDPFKHNLIKKGKDKLIFVTGHMLDAVMKANIDATVVYISSFSMLSKKSIAEIIELVKTHDQTVTIEENSVVGGLGDLIFDICSKNKINSKISKLGIPTKFITNYGKASEHRVALGLDELSIKNYLEGEI